MTQKEKRRKAYSIIDSSSGPNMAMQAASGFLGFPWTLAADSAAVVASYLPMVNKLRKLYNRPALKLDDFKTIFDGCKSEILVDLVMDKMLGNIPVVGMYFNLICARSMSWRLGILVAMLSAKSSVVRQSYIGESMSLIRKMFPQTSSMKFDKPSYQIFDFLMGEVENLSEKEYEDAIKSLLFSYAGKAKS